MVKIVEEVDKKEVELILWIALSALYLYIYVGFKEKRKGFLMGRMRVVSEKDVLSDCGCGNLDTPGHSCRFLYAYVEEVISQLIDK